MGGYANERYANELYLRYHVTCGYFYHAPVIPCEAMQGLCVRVTRWGVKCYSVF